MNRAGLQDLLTAFGPKKVLVLGDLMLDHYLWGKVNRISPEAPVPVVNVFQEEYRLGGAANVVLNIRTLGATPVVVGVCGNDNAGEELFKHFIGNGIDTSNIVVASRPTTVKTRVIAHNQHVVRVDREEEHDLDPVAEEKVLAVLDKALDTVDAVLLEDYNKGLLTPRIIDYVCREAQARSLIVTVDPKFKNFFRYTGCTVFKPNFNELVKNIGRQIDTDEQFVEAGRELLTTLQAEWVIVTRGEKGLTVFPKTGEPVNIPTFAREVFDVSGAGDTVIATLTLCLACGANMVDAATVANHAAGSVVAKVGIHPARPQDIVESFLFHLGQ